MLLYSCYTLHCYTFVCITASIRTVVICIFYDMQKLDFSGFYSIIVIVSHFIAIKCRNSTGISDDFGIQMCIFQKLNITVKKRD